MRQYVLRNACATLRAKSVRVGLLLDSYVDITLYRFWVLRDYHHVPLSQLENGLQATLARWYSDYTEKVVGLDFVPGNKIKVGL